MAVYVLLILAVLWAAFFLWPLVQRRLAGGRRNSIGDFTKKVTVISRVGGHRTPRAPRGLVPLPTPGPANAAPQTTAPAGLPMSAEAQRRRRDALAILAVAALGTLLLAVVAANPVVWLMHIVADLLLIGYVGLLVSLRRRADERKAKVHFLPQPSLPSPALVLRRTASS